METNGYRAKPDQVFEEADCVQAVHTKHFLSADSDHEQIAKCALTGCANPARPAMPGCVLQDQVDTLNPRSNALNVQRSERMGFKGEPFGPSIV